MKEKLFRNIPLMLIIACLVCYSISYFSGDKFCAIMNLISAWGLIICETIKYKK